MEFPKPLRLSKLLLLDGVLPCMFVALLLTTVYTLDRMQQIEVQADAASAPAATARADPARPPAPTHVDGDTEPPAPLLSRREQLQRAWLTGGFIALGIGLLGWLSLARLLAHTARPMAQARDALTAIARGELAGTMDAASNEAVALAASVGEIQTRVLALAASERERRYNLDDANLMSLRTADLALHSKNRFLAEVSHHFRQPLQALQLLGAGLRVQTNPGGSELAAQLQRNIDRMSVLLDGLLELAQLDAGVLVPRPQPFALDGWLARETAALRERAQQHGVRVVLHGSGLVLHSDPALLARLLRELLTNAIEHAPDGRVLVATRRRGHAVRLEVRDSGTGIAILQQRRIFDEFVQLPRTDDDHASGYGLGLATAARLAALLQSRIELRSAPGRGSTFALDLPSLPAVAARPLQASSA